MNRDEAEAREQYADRYGLERRQVNDDIERAVIGGDWGASGYTTMAQADELADILALGPGRLLLDVGAGRGWPGLYLAKRTGCDALLTDLPLEGLRLARARAAAEDVADQVRFAVASAAGLPLRPKSVDAVVSTDVLC